MSEQFITFAVDFEIVSSNKVKSNHKSGNLVERLSFTAGTVKLE